MGGGSHSPGSAVKKSEVMIFSITYCEKSDLSIKVHDKNGKMKRADLLSSVNVQVDNAVGFVVCFSAGLQNVDGPRWIYRCCPF